MRPPSLLLIMAMLVIGAAPPPRPLLSASDLPVAQLLPPPPSDASLQHAAELVELASLERTRTAASLGLARADDAKKDASIFSSAIGPRFILDRLPETAMLMRMVRMSEKVAADRAKEYFKRPRPWIVNPRIKACSREDAPLTSYPSGHTTMAFSMAAVLVRLMPSRTKEIMSRAAQFGENRLVCEVHYRSDITAGEALGLIVAERLMEKAEFRQQFARARAELAGAGMTN